MPAHDLTPKITPFLDRHLVFPLLEFLQVNGIYTDHEMLQAKFALLAPTNMTDYVSTLWKQLHPDASDDDIPSEYAEKRQLVLDQMSRFEQEGEKVLRVLEDPEVKAALRQDKAQNLQYLREKHDVPRNLVYTNTRQITVDMINVLYQSGRFQYDCGDYTRAADLLYHFRILSTDSDLVTSATWGVFASEILQTNWDETLEELVKLREILDSKTFSSPVAQLHHRTWILHWSLFPFFNHESGREALCEVFFQPAYLNTIQTACPWLLRYLVVSVIVSRKQGKNTIQNNKRIKEVAKIIDQERYEYSDPVTEFMHALYIRFDFEQAQFLLGEAKFVLSNDFFLVALAEPFIVNCRFLISEAYCRIHQRINIRDLANKISLPEEEGERFVVDLIRDARLDGKIDYKEGTLIMKHTSNSICQQVIERTKYIHVDSLQANSVIQSLSNRTD
ncbi:Eukaryotic translation initiation factor 3 subunit E [Neolecta irregularis DAH-3]|uniref:Eukaryotic translation initiation factor 3 subunit E n=1 Tax=Neolecta irregularis (strain DAH-3) TaxID=1198029 RepID=A0A1U7LGY9_NEOID|nr:Eukaryotic translation initiation factor 3 subunit E [Neolecta irregularis DAH-3]|eukprot:OLL21863.1 Eukaryotic translation initiation factor 3 subunit E [Neolecta irregularis DAH-3]